MIEPVLHIFKNADELASGFIEHLLDLSDTMLTKKNKINISLSGGSTPKKVFVLIKEKYSNNFKWDKMHFYWGDERCVPSEDNESNYGEAKRLLFDHIQIPNGNIHYIIGNNQPETEVKRYTNEILKNIEIINDIPCIDINILGMGDDGHTASIFPDQMNLLNTNDLCSIATHPVTKQKRITLTGKILNNAQYTYLLVSGKNKAGILKEVLQNQKEALNYPIYYINPASHNLEYFIDEEAADFIG